MNVEAAIDALIAREGGFVDHPADRGGPTRWGISEARARAGGYAGDMRDFPREIAVTIYRERYWLAPRFDQVASLSQAIAAELLDSGVNMGPAWPALWLQRWLNACNRRQADYPDLFVDGRIGLLTLAALRAFLRKRGPEGERVLLAALNCSQGHRYLTIAEADATQEDFLYGWIRTRVAGAD